MNRSSSLLSQLNTMRNRFGKNAAAQKITLLQALAKERLRSKRSLLVYYECLLFLLAYPDNRAVYETASQSLKLLEELLKTNSSLRDRLFNTGTSFSELCSSFSFEMVKWFCTHHREQISFDSFDADDSRISSILTVVLPRSESEILQDANEHWRSWIKQSAEKGEDMLDRLVAVFDEADISPFVRDELWASLGLNTVIRFTTHPRLPGSLAKPFYHRSLQKKKSIRVKEDIKPEKIKLTEQQAAQIIGCARTILVQHLREIDPITFTAPPYVSYYHLTRGVSIALMEMVPARRSPVECYIGYMVFKNGMPVAYAGSWILFDSGRIGLNIFPSYRGGESKFIFEQVLNLHRHVYDLHRFTVDPYQIGKDNADGIQSGAFWIWYRAGFRPLKKEQYALAESEAQKIESDHSHRSPANVLKKLADSRMELILRNSSVRFDATDLSRVFLAIVKTHYHNNRKEAREYSLRRLARLLQVKHEHDDTMHRILAGWAVFIFSGGNPVRLSRGLKNSLKKLIALKCAGREEEYIRLLQRSQELRRLMESLVKKYG